MLGHSTFRVSKYQLHLQISRVGGEEKRRRERRREREGSTPDQKWQQPLFLQLFLWYCTLRLPDRIIDRWMDEEGWKRGKGLVQRSCPFLLVAPQPSRRFPCFYFFIFFSSLSPFLAFRFRVFILFSLFFFNSLSFSLLFFLLGFRYLIKSSYEKGTRVMRFFLFFSRVTEAAMLVRDGTTK